MAENIKTTVEELRKLINVDNVIGTPIETEDKILIPEGTGAAGAGAGVEPISMVMIPKRGNDAEGVRVLDLSKGTETNKALSDLGLIITDLVKSYMGAAPEEYVDEEEFIEPEFTTYDDEKTKE